MIYPENFFITPTSSTVIKSADFKQRPTDFIVTEQLGFGLTGSGEHLCVYVEKHNANTNQIAGALAKWAGIPAKDVSFCGLKDKFAVTSQWFSLRTPNKTLPTEAFTYSSEVSHAKIIDSQWHQKKLGRGSHKTNRFSIHLQNIVGSQVAIVERLKQIKTEGVPNYFMAQRFGHQGKNLDKAMALFDRKRKFRRDERSIILSSARSYLFNQILASRVQNGTWNTAMTGDVFNLAGSGSIFTETIDDSIKQRIQDKDIHPTGALWGAGVLKSNDAVAELENSIAANNAAFADGLVAMGLKQARRPLRLMVDELTWEFNDESTLVLNFSLGTGSYATAVLAELIEGFIG